MIPFFLKLFRIGSGFGSGYPRVFASVAGHIPDRDQFMQYVAA
jgi:hypothetical protein